MKLFYSPSYSGFVFADKSKIMFNQKIVDTAGLVQVIELHAGMNTEGIEDIERIVEYYQAMKTYMQANPENVLKASFDVDALSVAKECLLWRDTLTFAGWNKSLKAPSKRMEVLSGVEEYFSSPSLGERLLAVTKAVQNGCSLPQNLCIETPVDYKLFSPLESGLVQALADRGVAVTIKELPSKPANSLNAVIKVLESSSDKKEVIQKDDSFNILHFEEQDDALKYLSLQEPDSYEVWINSDNKALDDWLYLQGKATSGSRITGGLPLVTQLLPIGLGTLASPMDLKNMFEWLNVQLSPLDFVFRKELEGGIAREGGYYNKRCRKIIEDFVKAEPEVRQALVKNFLPDINAPESVTDGTVSIKKAIEFTSALYDWCEVQAGAFMDEILKKQLRVVQNECAAVLNTLQSEKEERMSFQKLMTFVSNLKAGVDMLQYQAEEGCRTVVAGPGALVSTAKSLIWCDFYNDAKEVLKYDFLLPAEKKEFRTSLLLWDEDTEREYNYRIKMLPFYMAEKITLVVIDRKVTDRVETHPLYIQLQNKIKNIKDFIQSPDVNKLFEKLLQDAPLVNNAMDAQTPGITIRNGKLIKWPETEYATSFEQIVHSPFDYAFSYLAGISAKGNAAIPQINQTYGSVAHAVIETLFNKYEDIPESGTVPYIKENIKNNFDKVFTDMVNACGAVLLLKENILNLPNYKAKVFSSVNALVKLLEDNKLHVLACEPWLQNTQINFYGGTKIGGYADMILADEQNNPIIFDFKWTGKEDKFKQKIAENKSIQLELYKYLTTEFAGSEAQAVAYVILPEVTVISAQDFAGENTIKVTMSNTDSLMTKLKNSYKYRREQITEGFIEEAEGFAPDLIQYQKDCEEENLIPLEFGGRANDLKKKGNDYSNYTFFNRRK